jgi:predicted MFS family arabinose efflux permease
VLLPLVVQASSQAAWRSSALFVGFAAVGVLLFALYYSLAGIESCPAVQRRGLQSLSKTARKDITRLSALFSIDAFGGSFVSVYVLSSWFLLAYGVPPLGLAAIFSTTNVLVVVSIYAAALIARRLGNLRTMVYTHLVSNVFLVAIPLAGSLTGALVFLFLRQSMSQMDVPTRQALMAEMFQKEDRVGLRGDQQREEPRGLLRVACKHGHVRSWPAFWASASRRDL